MGSLSTLLSAPQGAERLPAEDAGAPDEIRPEAESAFAALLGRHVGRPAPHPVPVPLGDEDAIPDAAVPAEAPHLFVPPVAVPPLPAPVPRPGALAAPTAEATLPGAAVSGTARRAAEPPASASQHAPPSVTSAAPAAHDRLRAAQPEARVAPPAGPAEAAPTPPSSSPVRMQPPTDSTRTRTPMEPAPPPPAPLELAPLEASGLLSRSQLRSLPDGPAPGRALAAGATIVAVAPSAAEGASGRPSAPAEGPLMDAPRWPQPDARPHAHAAAEAAPPEAPAPDAPEALADAPPPPTPPTLPEPTAIEATAIEATAIEATAIEPTAIEATDAKPPAPLGGEFLAPTAPPPAEATRGTASAAMTRTVPTVEVLRATLAAQALTQQVVRLRLAGADGELTVRTRRSEGRLEVQVVFSDTRLHTDAAQSAERLRATLEQQLGTHVDLSFGSDDPPAGGDGERGGERLPEATPASPRPSGQPAAMPSSRPLGPREWIG